MHTFWLAYMRPESGDVGTTQADMVYNSTTRQTTASPGDQVVGNHNQLYHIAALALPGFSEVLTRLLHEVGLEAATQLIVAKLKGRERLLQKAQDDYRYVCMFVYMYTGIYVSMYIHVRMAPVCVYVRMYASMYLCM